MPDIYALLQDPVWQYYLSAVIMLWPMTRIFRRAGFRGWEAAVLFIPMVGHVLCAGLLVFRGWSRRKAEAA